MLRSYLLTFILLTVLAGQVAAQGVTKGAITGRVLTTEGEALTAVNLKAIHQPSGTKYNAVSRNSGQYNFPNLRIGGPYMLKATHVGYKDRTLDSIYVQLGDELRLNITMVEEASELEAVEIRAEQGFLSGNETGVSTNINQQQIEKLPTLNRSFRDFTRLTPQKGSGLSFAGRNNFYNNLTVDGSLLNNSFGLAPLPGGQTNAQVVSLDAVKLIQVGLALYYVI